MLVISGYMSSPASSPSPRPRAPFAPQTQALVDPRLSKLPPGPDSEMAPKLHGVLSIRFEKLEFKGRDNMSLPDKPFVSVLTPVYNGEAYLAECIESVLAQTYPNFEYIIVNNCSKDRTLEIAQSYAKK